MNLSLLELQQTLPWNSPSHDEQGLHAVLHIVKAAANLAMVYEEAAHRGPGALSAEEIQDLVKPMADVVICAARLAQVTGLELEDAVIHRVVEKNPGCGW